jgi:membrane fusion protein, multidrug efflux system
MISNIFMNRNSVGRMTFVHSFKSLVALLVISLLFTACNSKEKDLDTLLETSDLEQIRKKREEVHLELEKVSATLAKIDARIAVLDDTQLPLVEIQTLAKQAFTHFIDVRGNVETKENIMITPEFNGVLTSLNVRAGDRVRKGQVLARIDDGGMSAQLAQAQTQLQLAKTTFERQEKLWQQKIGSEIQYLQAKTSFESQEKMVAQMNAQIAKTFVRAPFDGTVEDVKVEKGQVVGMGTELMRIVNLRDMYVTAQIPEAYLAKIKMNAPVNVAIQSIGKNFVGKVRQISNFINPNNRSFTVEVALNDPENLLRPNQVAVLSIEDYVNNEALLIPQNALLETGDGKMVAFVIEKLNAKNEGSIKRIAVETGLSSGPDVEIKKGLNVGDQVVIEGIRNIKEGAKAQVVKKP